MGHLNYPNLNVMCKLNMVKGKPNINVDKCLCQACLFSKQHKAWRARQKLGFVHSDLCGPMQTASLGGAKYFVTFIDDFYRKAWIYLLKDKSKTFEAFKEFKQEAENESRLKIKILRSNNGGEYNSKEFNQYCKQHGIKRQFSTPYTPQQNRVAERMNRTL